MTLTDLAAIGSFVSGIAVLVSLIYLAIQVRHAQRTQRALMHQARVDRVTNASLALMQPGVVEVLAKAAANADLSPAEMMQLYYYVRILVAAVDDAIWQAEAGFLDKQSLDTAVLTVQRVMVFPSCRAAWHMLKPQIAPSLRERIDKIIEEAPASGHMDWAAAWKDAYAKATANPVA